MSERLQVVKCPHCPGHRIDTPGPHSPRYVVREGLYVLVDCRGEPIPVPMPAVAGQ